jgi:protein ImuB
MALRACINIDSLPLQILLRANPGWEGTPVAVTRDERPQSAILAVNAAAREKGVVPGMRYAAALSLVPALKARAVPPDSVAGARDSIMRVIGGFTPDIEPCPFDTDAAWASVEGMRTLFASDARWSLEVRAALKVQGFSAVVVVGFTRYGTWAIARSRPRSMVLATREEERGLLNASPIDILPVPERVRATLRKLEIRTIGKLAALPEGETTRRFGREVGALLRSLSSDDPLPVQPVSLVQAAASCRHLDTPLVDLELLMSPVDELLGREVQQAEASRCVVAGLTLVLRSENGEVTTELVRPSVPTLKTVVLRRLILLRLSARQLTSGVEEIELRAELVAPSRAQEELFAVKGRDLAAGARAFAALRARFGNEAVVRVELCPSWLPEKSFRFVPVEKPALPSPGPAAGPAPSPSPRAPAVRRIFFEPKAARPAAAGRGGRDPFEVNGAWWSTDSAGGPYRRGYAYQDTPAGIRWWYVDRLSDTCWDQGVVD